MSGFTIDPHAQLPDLLDGLETRLSQTQAGLMAALAELERGAPEQQEPLTRALNSALVSSIDLGRLLEATSDAVQQGYGVAAFGLRSEVEQGLVVS